MGEARRRQTIARETVVAILLYNEALPFALDEPLAAALDEHEREAFEHERELVQDWLPFKPLPAFSDPAIEVVANMWETVTNSSCRFPLGDPKSPSFAFCGATTSRPPYCPACSARTFVKRTAPRAPFVARSRISGVRLRCIA